MDQPFINKKRPKSNDLCQTWVQLNRGSYVYILRFTVLHCDSTRVQQRAPPFLGQHRKAEQPINTHKPTTSLFHSPPSRVCVYFVLSWIASMAAITGPSSIAVRSRPHQNLVIPLSFSQCFSFVFFFSGKFLCVSLILVYLLVVFSTW